MLGGMLSGGPSRMAAVLQIHFPDFPESDQEIAVVNGDSVQIRDEEKLIAIVKVAGIYAGPINDKPI
jgi:hypothetical protein